MIYKLMTIRFLAAVLSATLFMPVMVSAQNDRPDKPAGDRAAKMNFCENLDTFEDKIIERIRGKADQVDAKRDARVAQHKDKKAERLAELDAKRTDNNAKRDERYDALRDRAQTDEQSAAVETFIDTVEELVAARKAAVDAAIEAFEEAVEEIKEAANASRIDDMSEELEQDVSQAFNTADSACGEGDDPKEVREALRADLAAIIEDFKKDNPKEDLRAQLEEARAVRKAAFEAARADFREGLEAAKADLKAAFSGE